MTQIPLKVDIIQVLSIAGSTYHEYQTTFLNGINDEQWAGFYAAYTLGRLGDFMAPSKLAIKAPNSEY